MTVPGLCEADRNRSVAAAERALDAAVDGRASVGSAVFAPADMVLFHLVGRGASCP
jgi:hypothetical protein